MTEPHNQDISPEDDPVSSPPSVRDLNVPLIAVVGVISVLLLLTAVFGTQAWFRYEVNQEYQEKAINRDFEQLQALNRRQKQTLTGPPHWQDAKQGVVSVPIDQAIDRLIRQRGREQAPATQPRANQ